MAVVDYPAFRNVFLKGHLVKIIGVKFVPLGY